MLHSIKQRKEEGFTIIEVLIVLAIAGLIMMVVFMAVPSLQRNSRNTQRKSDVSAIVGAMSEFVNNNGGKLPATCAAGATGCAAQTWLQNATLSTYDVNNVQFTNGSAAPTLPTSVDVDSIRIFNRAKCSSPTAATTSNATSRSVAALYSVETSGAPQLQCTEL